MASQSQERRVLAETTIVDADVHVSISPKQMARHLDEPYASRTLNKFCYPASVGSDWDPMLGGKIEMRMLTDPEQVQEELCKDLDIDYPILNAIMGLAKLPDTDLAVELMRARNDAMLDVFLDDSDFHGLALVAPQDPQAAAEEIDRMGREDQIAGVFIESTGSRTPLGDPQFDPIYEAAADNDLHIAYHAAAAGNFEYDFPKQNQGFETFLEVHALAHLWGQTQTLTSLMVQGVPAKFPELNFVFLESGVSWVPYMMWRLNKEYSIRRSEAPLLEKSPEEYIRDQCYFASQPLGEPNDAAQMKQMLDIIGPESLMFATDYPHWDFDHPDELDKYLRTMFSETERDQVLHETPAEAFGLDV